MVISELLSAVLGELENIDNSAFEARHIIAFSLSISPFDLILNAKKEVSKEDETKVFALVKRRLSGEPLQYILGTQEFMSLSFLVSRDTLIPRQDTETLVEFLLSEEKDLPISLLDIGTGTGCIPISTAHFRKNFNCLGVDVSENTIALARKNAENIGVADRVKFEVLDILYDIPKGIFDVVVSNPPYIKSDDIKNLQSEVRDFEPHTALDGGNDGLTFYRRICAIAPQILKDGGLLVFEIGYDQAEDVSKLMEKNFKDIKIVKDLCGNNRVIAGYLN